MVASERNGWSIKIAGSDVDGFSPVRRNDKEMTPLLILPCIPVPEEKLVKNLGLDCTLGLLLVSFFVSSD